MGLLKRLFKGRPAPAVRPETVSPAPELEAAPAAAPEIRVSISVREVEREPVGELSRLDFGKGEDVLGCFLNFEPAELFEPSEKQRAYLRDLGVPVPAGVTNRDATCMISRATGEDTLESPSTQLAALASGLGIQFSAYIGARGLLGSIVAQASDLDRAAFYGYAVLQSELGQPLGNMLEAPERAQCYAFAEKALADPALMRSLSGRLPEDYTRPNRGTAIYKAAASCLLGGAA